MSNASSLANLVEEIKLVTTAALQKPRDQAHVTKESPDFQYHSFFIVLKIEENVARNQNDT